MNELPKALQYLQKIQLEQEGKIGSDEYRSKRKIEEDIFREALEGGDFAEKIVPPQLKSFQEFYSQNYSVLKSDVPETQSIIDFYIISQIKQVFDQIIQTSFEDPHKYHISPNVFFGTSESPVLNARISSVPQSEEYLIVINRGLWVSTTVLSFLISTSLEFPEEVPIPTGFDETKAITNERLFNEVVNLLLGRGTIIEFPPIDIHTSQNYHWELVDETIKDFVVGHEYGHFLHNHFSQQAAANFVTVVVGSMKLPVHLTSWENEYRADRTALDLTVFKSRQKYIKMAQEIPSLYNQLIAEGMLVGVEGALIFLYLLLQAERLRGVVYTPESSHPPTWFRIQQVWGVLGQQIRDAYTFEYAKNRLSYSIRSLEFFFKTFNGRMPLSPEQIFQDNVFQSLFQYTHKEVIAALKKLYDSIDRYTGRQELNDGSFQGTPAEDWYQLLMLLLRKQNLERAECLVMIQRCIDILERNSRALNLPVTH